MSLQSKYKISFRPKHLKLTILVYSVIALLTIAARYYSHVPKDYTVGLNNMKSELSAIQFSNHIGDMESHGNTLSGDGKGHTCDVKNWKKQCDVHYERYFGDTSQSGASELFTTIDSKMTSHGWTYNSHWGNKALVLAELSSSSSENTQIFYSKGGYDAAVSVISSEQLEATHDCKKNYDCNALAGFGGQKYPRYVTVAVNYRRIY